MPSMTERKCKCCGSTFMARTSDVKRGWAKFCSKSCKAIWQEQKTHQCSDYFHRQKHRQLCEDAYIPYDPSAQFHPRTGEFEGYSGCDHDHDCNKE